MSAFLNGCVRESCSQVFGGVGIESLRFLLEGFVMIKVHARRLYGLCDSFCEGVEELLVVDGFGENMINM